MRIENSRPGDQKRNSDIKKLIFILSIALFTPVLLIAPQSQSQMPSKIKADDQVYREYMVTISRQLGVTCETCHNTANFTSSEKAQYKVSKAHIHLTQLLIDNGFDGQNGHPKADCYMCHRGQLRPAYKEPFDPMVMEKAKSQKKNAIPAPGKDEDTD
jgi:hypothetical protein